MQLTYTKNKASSFIRTLTNKNSANFTFSLHEKESEKLEKKFKGIYTGNYEIATGECLIDFNCFLPYGICLNKTACLCMPDFANVYKEEYSLENIKCTYKKKKLIIAGLLELFLPLSLGHFYIFQIKLGLIKLVYNLLVYSMCFILFAKSQEVSIQTMMICIFLSCLIPIWNITDMILFFTGYYKDGYGVHLN